MTAASTVFVITGRDEAELADMRRRVRQQIAFYASTPAYRRVLEVHGWEFGPRLTASPSGASGPRWARPSPTRQ